MSLNTNAVFAGLQTGMLIALLGIAAGCTTDTSDTFPLSDAAR